MDDKRLHTGMVTGHRTIRPDHLDIVKARTEIEFRRLIQKQDIRWWGCGGAIGYDTLCASILFRLRATEFPHIKVILVAPFPGYTSRWTDEQKATYEQMLPLYDKRVFVSQTGSREAYLKRDRHLVDNSSIVIAYKTRESGGTAYTVRYAEHQNIPVINIAP